LQSVRISWNQLQSELKDKNNTNNTNEDANDANYANIKER